MVAQPTFLPYPKKCSERKTMSKENFHNGAMYRLTGKAISIANAMVISKCQFKQLWQFQSVAISVKFGNRFREQAEFLEGFCCCLLDANEFIHDFPIFYTGSQILFIVLTRSQQPPKVTNVTRQNSYSVIIPFNYILWHL